MCGVIVMPGNVPERVVGGQRLAPLHVERGAAQMARAHRRDQVGLDDVRAARDVDDVGAARHQRERAGVEDAFGLGGERQRADDDLARREQRPRTISAERRFQPRTTRPQRSSQARDLAAHRAGAEHADAMARDRQRLARPVALALLRLVALERRARGAAPS